jgi:hypothetical protein
MALGHRQFRGLDWIELQHDPAVPHLRAVQHKPYQFLLLEWREASVDLAESPEGRPVIR